MTHIADQAYLRNQQYKDASNFNARVELHRRFSTNPYGFARWVFDQLLDLPDRCDVLEIGCGPAYLWAENRERVPEGWTITLADFSPGMIAEARRTTATIPHPFGFEVADMQALPFSDAHFDAVIANHMLYHVPDREQAYAEVRRVLRPGGRFFAATNGERHLREIHELAKRFTIRRWESRSELSFLLENGGAELARWFDQVELRRYEDGLIVPEAEPIVAFMLSMADTIRISAEDRAAIVAAIQQQIDADGPLRITKDSGLFVAVRGAA